MEKSLGADFSAVRIHEGQRAASIGALAFTQGTNIHFAPGQYDPNSESGQSLLGHELTHVVQQSEGRVKADAQAKGLPVNAEPGLEREADEMGAKAARGEPARDVSGSTGRRPISGSDAPMQATWGSLMKQILATTSMAAVSGTGAFLMGMAAPGIALVAIGGGGIGYLATRSSGGPKNDNEPEGVSDDEHEPLVTTENDNESDDVEEEEISKTDQEDADAFGTTSHELRTKLKRGPKKYDEHIHHLRDVLAPTMKKLAEIAKSDKSGEAAEAWQAWNAAVTELIPQYTELCSGHGRVATKKQVTDTRERAKLTRDYRQVLKQVEAYESTLDKAYKKLAGKEIDRLVKKPEESVSDSDKAKKGLESSDTSRRKSSKPKKKPNRGHAPKKSDKTIDVAQALAKTHRKESSDEILATLCQLIDTHGARRACIAHEGAKGDLDQMAIILMTAKPFGADTVVELLVDNLDDPTVVEFLRDVRVAESDISLDLWESNFERWKTNGLDKLTQGLKISSEDEEGLGQASDLIAKYGMSAVRWALEQKLESNIIEDWLEITSKKGGKAVRKFVSAHIGRDPRGVWLFLDKQKNDPKRSSLEWAREYEKWYKTSDRTKRKVDRPEVGGTAKDGGMVNTGTDCFMLSVCQLLTLPAYANVPLPQRVRDLVNQVSAGADITGTDVRELRTYLAQLGIVEHEEGAHEDAAQLLDRLLEASDDVIGLRDRRQITGSTHRDPAPEGAPALGSMVNYNGDGVRETDSAPEHMLNVPVTEHAGLVDWLRSSHETGHTDRFTEDLDHPGRLEWANVGGQLHTVRERSTRTRFRSLPQNLTIRLLRFENDGSKINDAFDMPEQFEVTEDGDQRRRLTYQLQGFVVHSGTSRLGHYWAHRRNQNVVGEDDPQWLTANDESVEGAHAANNPMTGDIERDIERGYIYTYTQTAAVNVDAWANPTGQDFDPDNLLEAEDDVRAPVGLDEVDSEPWKHSGSDKARKQLWYGIDSLGQNQSHKRSTDHDTEPGKGALNEGPCGKLSAELAKLLRAEFVESGDDAACMVGVVQGIGGQLYAARSGRPGRPFRRAVAKMSAKVIPVLTGKIVTIHEHDDERYINANDLLTFGGKSKSTKQLYNHPKPDKRGEVALGAPGTCALPKLMKHLIDVNDIPIHASERWCTTKGNSVNIVVAEKDKRPTKHNHGDSVGSCKTCRGIVPVQMEGIGAKIEAFKKDAKKRTLEIQRKQKLRDDQLARFTSLVRSRVKVFHHDLAKLNENVIGIDDFVGFRDWYYVVVENLVADRLSEIVDVATTPGKKEIGEEAEGIVDEIIEELGDVIAAYESLPEQAFAGTKPEPNFDFTLSEEVENAKLEALKKAVTATTDAESELRDALIELSRSDD